MALAFSGDGKRLVVVTGDNKHTVYIYHWRSKTLIYSNVGHNGQPPQVPSRGACMPPAPGATTLWVIMRSVGAVRQAPAAPSGP